MPYFSCPACDLTLYGEAPASSSETCPRCNTQLVATDQPSRRAGTILHDQSIGADRGPVTALLTLPRRISRRFGRGAPPALRPRAPRPSDESPE